MTIVSILYIYIIANPLSKAVNDAYSTFSVDKKIPDNFATTFDGWVSKQQELFLNLLYNFDDISQDQLDYLYFDVNLKSTDAFNMEIRYNWLLIELKKKQDRSKVLTVDFLSKIGRMKYVRDLFDHLYDFDKPLALATFSRLKSSYHSLVVDQIEQDFNKKGLKYLIN